MQAPTPSPAPNATKFDPRTLLTVEEAKAIFNQDVHFSEPEQLGQFAGTLVQNKSENILANLQISTIDYAKAKFDADVAEQAKILDASCEPVEGLGESAFRMGELLMALKNGKWVQVTITKRPGVDPVSATNKVMEKVLTRIN